LPSAAQEVLTLADIPAPQAKAEEVKIRVRAFGLNRAEVYRRTGMMGPIDSPVVPGIEAVGEVISDASGTFRTGQRVATAMGGMQFSRPGSYAEEVAVLRSNVIDLHGTTLSWEELAALGEQHESDDDRGKLPPRRWLRHRFLGHLSLAESCETT
jgi:NADPH2:quinone reductase